MSLRTPVWGSHRAVLQRQSVLIEMSQQFQIRSGSRIVATRSSSNALEAAVDHVRHYGSSSKEITILGPDTVSWRGARFVAVALPANSRDNA